MYILGISCYFHDSAASLIKDGEIIAAVQEERFSRIKQDSRFPKQSIEYCLKEANIAIKDIDKIVFYEDPAIKFKRLKKSYFSLFPWSIPLIFKTFLPWIFIKKDYKKRLAKEFKKLFSVDINNDFFANVEHHKSHASSAFYPSPFNESAILVMDGVGEFASTTIWKARSNEIKKVCQINFPHSLGLLYSAFTYYTGFKVNSGEYKMMGLAPYGTTNYINLIKNNLIHINDDGTFKIDMSYFSYHYSNYMTNNKFHSLFGGMPRVPESIITQKEMDIASSIQKVTEEIVIKLSKTALKKCESNNLCIAGGVGLNCVANGKVLQEVTKNLWIQPASGDAGGSLGAALDYYYSTLGFVPKKNGKDDLMKGSYLGPSFSEQESMDELKEFKPNYQKLNENKLYKLIASEIDKGNIVGWFQGRAEFGPRALGNRSILGDPRNPEMQKTMNLKIKFRESFRPFAPVVIEKDVSKYFQNVSKSPYMLLVCDIKNEIRKKLLNKKISGFEKLSIDRSELPAITHVDYSARVQTTNKASNKKLYSLLSAFKEITGTSVLINTSFNVRGEPIVNSPKDAYICFMNSNIDILVIGNLVFFKKEQTSLNNKEVFKQNYGLD